MFKPGAKTGGIRMQYQAVSAGRAGLAVVRLAGRASAARPLPHGIMSMWPPCQHDSQSRWVIDRYDGPLALHSVRNAVAGVSTELHQLQGGCKGTAVGVP